MPDIFFQPAFAKGVIGRRIVSIVQLDVGDGEKWPALELDNGTLLVIQQDAEGNGGGFMDLLGKDEKRIGCAGVG